LRQSRDLYVVAIFTLVRVKEMTFLATLTMLDVDLHKKYCVKNKWGWCQRYSRWRTWLHLLELCLVLLSVLFKGTAQRSSRDCQKTWLRCTPPFRAR
jgi:hypothetical protein